MNKISVIFAIFIAFGFSKKYFSGDGEFYLFISSIPFLYAICVLRFHARRVICLLFALVAILFFSFDYGIKLIPSAIMIGVNWERIRIDISDKSLLIFSGLSLGYAVYQKYFGYSDVEWQFILSEVGSLSSAGVTEFEELRAMSFFNSVQNYTLFAALIIVYSFSRKHWWLLLVGVASLYFAGSRGVIVGCGIAMIMCYFKSFRISNAFLLSLVIYQALVLLPSTSFFDWKDDSNRLLIYGTFGYRVTILQEYFSNVSIYEVIVGLEDVRSIYDNVYLSILANIGIAGFIFTIPILWGLKGSSNYTKVLLSICVAYGFFSDLIFDLYLIFILALFIQAQKGRRLGGLEVKGKKPCRRRGGTSTVLPTKAGSVN